MIPDLGSYCPDCLLVMMFEGADKDMTAVISIMWCSKTIYDGAGGQHLTRASKEGGNTGWTGEACGHR